MSPPTLPSPGRPAVGPVQWTAGRSRGRRGPNGGIRYRLGAHWYDVVSGERWIYRAGRDAGIDLLRLAPGAVVLDLGCGTGLNQPRLLAETAPDGRVVGLDASASMLRQAARRTARLSAPTRVTLHHGDAATTELRALLPSGRTSVDAVVITYALSIFTDWAAVLDHALRVLRPDGRIVVVDLDLPEGRWSVLRPLARLACWVGGVHRDRQVWTALRGRVDDAHESTLRSGHIRVAAGTRRPG